MDDDVDMLEYDELSEVVDEPEVDSDGITNSNCGAVTKEAPLLDRKCAFATQRNIGDGLHSAKRHA